MASDSRGGRGGKGLSVLIITWWPWLSLALL